VAPVLAEKYNVVGMTRRGAGSSDKPDHGYDTARLSQDVIEVLDTLGIEAPILVGMSIAGEELSYLGSHYPERFRGLVYLDAAYDRTLSPDTRHQELNMSLPPGLPVRPSELLSYEALAQYAQRRGRPRNIPEGEVMASYDLTTGQIKHDSLYQEVVTMALQAPDYVNIKVPALGIFAMPGSVEFMMEPWYDPNDSQLRDTVSELFQYERRGREQQISKFDTEIADSEVLVLENGYHWVFLAHEQEVITAIDKFAARSGN
jgi:pimeloyl-ACP methyl ester carboxylesterase